jgi:hypothetical protein
MPASVPTTSWLKFADYWSFTTTPDSVVGIKTFEFFDTPDFDPIPVSDDDETITVDQKYLGRLDLVALDVYQDVNLWWIIALANDIVLIPTHMRLGMQLRIPSNATVSAYLSKKG